MLSSILFLSVSLLVIFEDGISGVMYTFALKHSNALISYMLL